MAEYELPLFPLNTVLFPGMPISLHIFEERYKAMINHCVDDEQPFGVVLISQGQEALGPLARPHLIGCAAQIVQLERLDDGRMNILAVGLERFRIHRLSYREPYLVGQVEALPMVEQHTAQLEQAVERLRPWIERYLNGLSQLVEDVEFEPSRLPSDPVALGYLAASLVQIPPDQKQPLLAANRPDELLSTVGSIYRREVALLDMLLTRGQGRTVSRFSLN